MGIEFYIKETGETMEDTNDYLFVMNDEVYCDNCQTYESQAAVISFEDCIKRRPDVNWRLSLD